MWASHHEVFFNTGRENRVGDHANVAFVKLVGISVRQFAGRELNPRYRSTHCWTCHLLTITCLRPILHQRFTNHVLPSSGLPCLATQHVCNMVTSFLRTSSHISSKSHVVRNPYPVPLAT